MSLKVITPPATEPLTLVQAQAYLKTDEDVTALIAAAREYCEDHQNKKYITQTLELILDDFPCGDTIEFPDCSPIQSVVSIKYYDTADKEYTFDSSNYIVDTDSFVARIVLGYCKIWPTTILRPAKGVIIRFNAGYGNASAVPETVKQAMVLHMRLLFNAMSPEDQKLYQIRRDALLGARRKVPV